MTSGEPETATPTGGGIVLRVELADGAERLSLPVDEVRPAWVVGLNDGVPVGERLLPASAAWRIADITAWARRAFVWDVRRHQARTALAQSLGLRPDGARPDAPRVSVIVCTRDRAAQLEECLESIARLDPPPAEVIVVDNAPSDDATRVLCAARGVTYVLEPQPGQTRARNRGIAQAGGDIVAFTDDDCVVDPRWLEGLDESFADPRTMAVTGYVGPLELATEAQLDFELHGGFERHRRPRVFDGAHGSVVWHAAAAGAGANMLLRRSACERVGGFAEDLGPGTPARSSDDKYFFYRVLREGGRIRHDPQRIVWHRHRADAAGLRRIFNDYGVSEFAWTWRLMTRHREIAALGIWKWWMGHYAGDVKRRLTRSPRAVPLDLTLQEVRGALHGVGAMRRSERSRAGIEPVAIDGVAPAAAAVRVERAALPELTVAIASYNRRDSLRETLRSLAAQQYGEQGFEVVLVLDGSTDGSGEMVRSLELPYPLRVHEQPNRGLAVSRNRGAELAQAPVVVFLDDDLRPAPDCLVAHGSSHRDGPAGMTLGHYPPAMRSAAYYALQVKAWWEDHFRRLATPGHVWTYADVCDGNSSIGVELFNRLGRFDEAFSGGRRQDYELGQRLIRDGVPLRFEPDALAHHHLDVSIASAIRNANAEGRYDVLLCHRHPELARSLPLSRVSIDPLGPRGRAIEGLVRSDALEPALAAFEAVGARRYWRRLFDAAWRRSYAAGVRSQLDGDRALRELVRAADARAERLEIDLASSPRLPERLRSSPAVVLRRGERLLVELDLELPDGQWDGEAVLEQLLPYVEL